MRPLRLVPLGAIVLAIWTTLAAGQEPGGNVADGRRLAERWCSSCHLLDAGGTRPGSDAPTFRQVAQLPSTTALALRAFLRTTHGGMPDIVLTPAETDDLIAFIMSLKGN